jgi:uncharacterized membrane-anchored protein
MTGRYERIRAALAMGPTPGPRLVCPTNSGVFVKSERVSGYLAEARHCRTTQDVRADAHLIAACDPDTIRELLEERDALREALKVLVNWIPSADTYRRLGFNPETPMRAHEAAKALLLKKDTHEGS